MFEQEDDGKKFEELDYKQILFRQILACNMAINMGGDYIGSVLQLKALISPFEDKEFTENIIKIQQSNINYMDTLKSKQGAVYTKQEAASGMSLHHNIFIEIIRLLGRKGMLIQEEVEEII